MQSAFVDIDWNVDAFLYVSDFMELEDSEDLDDVPTNRPGAGTDIRRSRKLKLSEGVSRRETPTHEKGEGAAASKPSIARVSGSVERD